MKRERKTTNGNLAVKNRRRKPKEMVVQEELPEKKKGQTSFSVQKWIEVRDKYGFLKYQPMMVPMVPKY